MSMIKNGDFLDFNMLNQYLIRNNIKQSNKLKEIHRITGGSFMMDDIIESANVSICGIGGFPVVNSEKGSLINGNIINKETLENSFYTMSGISAFMSYLNPSNMELNDLGEKVINDYNHLSILHTVSINLFVSGLSVGVEHEFSSQRDIIHLSRLTVAKTQTQNSPCLVLSDKDHLELYRKVLDYTKKEVNSAGLSKNSEVQNLLFPTAKASAIMITGSLKNILKLIELKNAGGKEKEFVAILEKIDEVLKKNIFELNN